ncbi:serine/threonine-protein kinase Nek7-like [Hydractinia symbiolongicarpus]|uniref:serine/threonine-protein kinase Nek7-like n=2 Tax=Hydractinia symbiolongicarpus TaxID=13093 RepID=UPI00255127F3|nr:serine/threonine-protein kinase Nek7-like [Hydractinia symbiolongicarpus]
MLEQQEKQDLNDSVISTRKRSSEKRAERNKKKKRMRQERKKAEFDAEMEKKILIEERIRELEFQNAVLKRNVPKVKATTSRDILLCCSSRSSIYRTQDKSIAITRTLNFNVIQFSKCDVHINETIGAGVFGNVSKGYVKSIKQVVAIKCLSNNARPIDAYAECKKGMLMAGDKGFPYVFGFLKPKFILLEFVCDDCGSCSPTLKEFIQRVPAPCSSHLNEIIIGLCSAVHQMHVRGLLHNDLHPGNVLVRNSTTVKLIDLGKATLVSDPARYDIEPGSSQQVKFNTKHLFLAHELRNVKGSYQSVQSDVYSLGYNVDLISRCIKNMKIASIANDMMSEEPSKRPSISRCITRFKNIFVNPCI